MEDGGQRTSFSPKKSPKEGRRLDGTLMAAMEEEEEVVKDTSLHSRPQAQHPSTGPASQAARGSSTSIPFIDCSDVDSEYDLLGGQLTPSHSQTNDNYEGDLTSSAYVDYTGENLKRSRYRISSASSEKASYQLTEDCSVGSPSSMSLYLGGTSRIPRHSSLVDETFRGPDIRSPLATPFPSSSKESSPHMSFSRTGSQSYVSDNGHDCRGRGEVHGVPTHGCHSYSKDFPIVQRPHLQMNQNACNQSETDPCFLSQVSWTPDQNYKSNSYRRGGMAKTVPLEGEGVPNGVPAIGPSKQSPVMQPLYARGMMDHLDGSYGPFTSSGTESSDSDSEMVSPFPHSVVFGNPVIRTSSPMPRNKFSFSSLQLEEEPEGASLGLSDGDGGRVFN